MSRQNIHTAMGSLAYAIAKADGEIQESEKKTIAALAQKEFELGDADIEIINKMFTRMQTENRSFEEAYRFAIDVLEANRYEFDFDQEMKTRCISFMQKIADAFSDTSLPEASLLKRFNSDLANF